MKLELVKPQQIFIDHLRKEKDVMGFIGMGIGKTAAVLYHLSELFLNAEAFGALIIAPLRVINLTWPSEIQQWDQLRWMRFANLRTQQGQRDFLNGNAHIFGINYESIPLLVSLVEARRGKLPYDVAVYDESTKAKNPGSKRIKAYRMKVPRVERNISLTGTPMPNSHRDLFAQVRLVDGGKRLGTNYRQFLDSYFTTTNYGGFPQYKEKAGAGESIEQKIADITVTLSSQEYLKIPETSIEDIEIPFCKDLQKKYNTLVDQLIIELRKDKTMNVGSAAVLVNKLLQFTSGEMYDDEKTSHFIHNLKFDALKKVVEKESSPMFVSYAYKHEEKRLREQFPYAEFFSEKESLASQKDLMTRWNAKKVRMVVASPASVGHGLNFQYGGSALAWISLTYNREHYEQFIARFARRGQTEVTRVYRLMVPGTVDDAVASALESKAANEARLLSALAMLEKLRNAK